MVFWIWFPPHKIVLNGPNLTQLPKEKRFSRYRVRLSLLFERIKSLTQQHDLKQHSAGVKTSHDLIHANAVNVMSTTLNLNLPVMA